MDREVRIFVLSVLLPALLLTAAGLFTLVFGVSGLAAELDRPDYATQKERYERNVRSRMATRLKAYLKDGKSDYFWSADGIPWKQDRANRAKYGIFERDGMNPVGWAKLDDGGAIGFDIEPFRYSDRTRLYLIVLGAVIVMLLFLVLFAGGGRLVASIRRARGDLAMRNSFLDMVSHELNTPLASIVPLSSALASGKIADARRRDEAIATISREAARMSKMIGELLTVARLKNRRLKASEDTVDLREIASSVVELASMRHPDCEISIEAGEAVFATADRDKTGQIAANLVDNACKYAGDGRIEVKCANSAGGRAQIAVCDRGPGVGDRDKEKIFERFYQCPQSGDTAERGLGLGLHIASQFAALMGGTLRVEDRAGGGSVFTLELPGLENRGG